MPEVVPQELVSVALGPPRSDGREVSFKAWRSVIPLPVLELLTHDIASAPIAMVTAQQIAALNWRAIGEITLRAARQMYGVRYGSRYRMYRLQYLVALR